MTIRPWHGENIQVQPFADEPERIGLTTETQARELAAGLLAACDWLENRGGE